jgi:hypothetical protein
MNNDNPPGILTGSNLISCIGDLTLQDHDDLTHCTQMATHSADRVSSRFDPSTKWLDEYMTTMDFLGWTVYQDAIFTRTTHIVTESIANFLVTSAQGMRNALQGNAMIDTLDALKPDKPALLSLDQESLKGERFQVIPACRDAKGFLEIAVFNLELVAYTKKNSFLFHEWEEAGVKVTQHRANLKLDKRVLESKRALIEKKRRDISMRRFNLRKL